MGQRMPPVPHIYGNDCLARFPAGKTPKYLYARFSQIVKCPQWNAFPFPTPPNDHTFKLTQTIDNPCRWFYYSDTWEVLFRYSTGPDRTLLSLLHKPTFYPCFTKVEPLLTDEGHVYHNDQQVCPHVNIAVGGIATVTWTQEATTLLESINMERADDLFMEMRPLVDGNKVYKFCKLKDGTNISIEFEPD